VLIFLNLDSLYEVSKTVYCLTGDRLNNRYNFLCIYVYIYKDWVPLYTILGNPSAIRLAMLNRG